MKRLKVPSVTAGEYRFLKVISKPITVDGKLVARCRFLYQFAEPYIIDGRFEIRLLPGESFEIEVPAIQDSGKDWEPCDAALLERDALRMLTLHQKEKVTTGPKHRGEVIKKEAALRGEEYRQFFIKYFLEHPSGPNPHSVALRMTAQHFGVNRKTIERATSKTRHQITREASP